jgi:flagellar P-ring protein precursor FlgI
MTVDVTVSSIGDAANLQGGLLLLSGLKGPDGQVYAMAQGPVVTGGFVAGRAGASQTVNHPTVGRVPGGAIVERTAPSVPPGANIRLQLHNADFTTAARVVEAINKRFGTGQRRPARADNSALVSVALPPEFAGRPIEFVAELAVCALPLKA